MSPFQTEWPHPACHNSAQVFNILVYETHGEFMAARKRCVRPLCRVPSAACLGTRACMQGGCRCD